MEVFNLNCDECNNALEAPASKAGYVVECPSCGGDVVVPETTTPAPKQQSAGDAYQQVADKVGFVPNIKKSDNIVQAICCGAGILVGSVAGTVVAGEIGIGTGLGIVGGLIVGAGAGGFIVMIRGMKR